MAVSFDCVDNKVKEADFFLEKLQQVGVNFDEARFYFSAFVTAARSITFVLQASLSDNIKSDEWYNKKQVELKSDPLARFFLEVRNEVQKRGSNPVSSFESESKDSIQYFFIYWYGDSPKDIPDLDVVTACKKYLFQLVKIIYECYKEFGPLIDPEQYYTVENLERMGITVYDILERDLGFPREWAGDVSSEVILKRIRELEPKPDIDYIFIKYLGHNRFGIVP